MSGASTSPAPRAKERPALPRDNWSACLVLMEDFAIFHLGWDPSRASYAIERLQEAHDGMAARGEIGAPLPERMADDAAWVLLDGFGDAWDGVNAGPMSTGELLAVAGDTIAETRKLAQLRNEMAAGMAALEADPARAAFVYAKLNQLEVPAKRRLPIDHPDYVSSGAMFRLATAYAEVWDQMQAR